MAFLYVVILLVTVFGLIYMQVPVIVWTLTIGVVLILVTIFGTLSYVFLSICWLLFLAAVLFAYLKRVRQRYFTQPIINLLR